tara:strand:+ start:618 stop:1262 length:645 start_codon:yes stop_codon:yes gene_type:complete
MSRYRHEVQLLNPTKKKWSLFKSIDRKIVNLVKKHGLKTINTFYKDDLFIKIVIFDDISDAKNHDLIFFKVGNFLGKHNIELKIISILEILPIVKKIKYLIKLVDSTPEKWAKYLDSDSTIEKMGKDEKIIRRNVIYNQNKSTLSVEVEYPNERSRDNLTNTIGEYLNNIGLHQEILEAVEFKDYSEDIIDLPLYSVNKLIDQAEKSLNKLSHM